MAKSGAEIEFGKTYRDMVTGFEGVATGRAQYWTGCDQILLVPTVDKDGKLREANWLDVQRLVDGRDGPLTLDNGSTPGADIPAPGGRRAA